MSTKPIPKEPKTYRELRDLLNTLPDEHLNKPIVWTGEDQGGNVFNFWVTDKDWHNGEEGLEPYAELVNYRAEEDMSSVEEARAELGPPDFPKGSLLLEVDPS